MSNIVINADILLKLYDVILNITGKTEFPSFEGFGEASSSGERAECKTTDDERHETNAAPGQGSNTNSVTADPNVREPSSPAPRV